MDEYIVYKYIEFLMISLYLIFVFLSVQIFFIWIDVDKSELRSKISENGSILKNSVITVFFVGVFLIIHEFVEGTKQSYLFFEIFELSGFLCVLCFIHKWHLTLKGCSHKKKTPDEFLFDACMGNIIRVDPSDPGLWIHKMINLRLFSIICIIGLMLALSVPVSTIYFAIIIGLVFIPPTLALASTLLGGLLLSKELSARLPNAQIPLLR